MPVFSKPNRVDQHTEVKHLRREMPTTAGSSDPEDFSHDEGIFTGHPPPLFQGIWYVKSPQQGLSFNNATATVTALIKKHQGPQQPIRFAVRSIPQPDLENFDVTPRGLKWVMVEDASLFNPAEKNFTFEGDWGTWSVYFMASDAYSEMQFATGENEITTLQYEDGVGHFYYTLDIPEGSIGGGQSYNSGQGGFYESVITSPEFIAKADIQSVEFTTNDAYTSVPWNSWDEWQRVEIQVYRNDTWVSPVITDLPPNTTIIVTPVGILRNERMRVIIPSVHGEERKVFTLQSIEVKYF